MLEPFTNNFNTAHGGSCLLNKVEKEAGAELCQAQVKLSLLKGDPEIMQNSKII